MSKYIKLEDAIEAYNQAVTNLVESEMEEFNLGDFTECSFNTTQIKLIERMIASLPTIEIDEDAISREDAVNALIAHFIPQTYTGEQVEQASKLAWKIMANAPSVIPKAKEGEWIPDPDGGFKCSNCRAEEDEFIYGTGMRYVNGESEFCPNCGAKMEGADDDED